MKKIIIFSVLLISIMFPLFSYAQINDNNTTNTGTSINLKIPNPLKCNTTDNSKCTLFDLIATILNKIVMPIMGVLVVLYIIYAGFKYVQAQGNPAAISKANDNLKYALIGAGILLAAAGISQVVQNTVTKLLE